MSGEEDVKLRKIKPIYCRGRWILGFALLFTGACCHLTAIAFINVVLLSANAATAILVNALLSIYFLGEKFICKFDLIAWSLIIAGNALIIAASLESDRAYTPEEIISILSSPTVIIFLISMMCFLAFSLVFMFQTTRKVRKFNRDAIEWANTQK